MLLPDCDSLRQLVHELLLAAAPEAPDLLDELELALLALQDEADRSRPPEDAFAGPIGVGLRQAIDQIGRLGDEQRPVADLIALGIACRHLVRALALVEGGA